MLASTAIATAIASLVQTGVNFKDISSFADQSYGRDVPSFQPDPATWVNGGTSSLQTFGAPNQRFWIVDRTFNYVYIHEQIGATRLLADYFPTMAANMDAIWEKLLELDVADVDITNVSWSKPQTVTDPSGAQFYGLTCSITVREKVNP